MSRDRGSGALALGPGPGALTGFRGGALLDIATPPAAIVGLASIVLVAVGLAVGVFMDREESNIWVMSLVAGAACGGAARSCVRVCGFLAVCRVAPRVGVASGRRGRACAGGRAQGASLAEAYNGEQAQEAVRAEEDERQWEGDRCEAADRRDEIEKEGDIIRYKCHDD